MILIYLGKGPRKPDKYTKSWMLPWENMFKTVVCLWKTLADAVEDLDTSRDFTWKKQFH